MGRFDPKWPLGRTVQGLTLHNEAPRSRDLGTAQRHRP